MVTRFAILPPVMLPAVSSIACEVYAPHAAQAAALAEIAEALARDVGQPLTIARLVGSRCGRPAGPVLTLRLPAELASSQHQVWCLACRLACFCPSARVSVLVLGAQAFAPRPDPAARRPSHTQAA